MGTVASFIHKTLTALNNSNAHTWGQGWLLVVTHLNHKITRELGTQDG